MKILLDTCTFLWILLDDPKLPSRARELFADPENKVFMSSISAWEIAIKHSLGRLSLPQAPTEYIPTQRKHHQIEALSLDEESALAIDRLPDLHRDPFDRALVAQAITHGLTLLTPDPLVHQYPARCTWA